MMLLSIEIIGKNIYIYIYYTNVLIIKIIAQMI